MLIRSVLSDTVVQSSVVSNVYNNVMSLKGGDMVMVGDTVGVGVGSVIVTVGDTVGVGVGCVTVTVGDGVGVGSGGSITRKLSDTTATSLLLMSRNDVPGSSNLTDVRSWCVPPSLRSIVAVCDNPVLFSVKVITNMPGLAR